MQLAELAVARVVRWDRERLFDLLPAQPVRCNRPSGLLLLLCFRHASTSGWCRAAHDGRGGIGTVKVEAGEGG